MVYLPFKQKMDTGSLASVELIKGVSACTDNAYQDESLEDSSNATHNSLLEYLLVGRGAKLLRYLHSSRIATPCSCKVTGLCISFLHVLTSLEPSDFSEGEARASCCTCASNVDVARTKRDCVWRYNNIHRRARRNSIGPKACLHKRKERLRRLSGRHYQTFFGAPVSSDDDTPNSSDEEVKLAAVLEARRRVYKSKHLQKHRPPTRMSSVEMNSDDEETAQFLSKIDALQAFEGPFELAGVLLDLLESSFCMNYGVASDADALGARNPDGHSPMSVAIQLISAITALQQTEGAAFSRSNSVNNEKVMSQISYEDTRWTLDAVCHLRKLIFRSVIVLCDGALKHGADLQELVQSQSISSLLAVCKSMIDSGGMLPVGYVSKIHKKHPDATDGSHSDQSLSNTEKLSSTPKEDAMPRVELPASEPPSHPHCQRFRAERVPSTFRNSCATLPANIAFVCDVITGIFNLLTRSLETGPGTINPKVLTEAASLLQEFSNCDGFSVFSTLLQRISALNFTVSRKLLPNLSPPTSPVKNGSFLSPKKSRSPSSHSPFVKLYSNLLATFQETVSSLQRSKVEYMHKVTCSRRNHRVCDFQRLVPVHHNILGLETRSRSKGDAENSVKANSNPSFSSSSAKGSGRHEDSTCVVATAVKFLVDLALITSDDSSFLKLVLQTLNRIGICHCLAPSSVVLPLVCNLPCWGENVQNMVFAYIAKLLIYHFNEDETSYRGLIMSFTSCSLLNVSTAWLHHPPLSSYFRPPRHYLRSRSETWRRSLPGDICLVDNTVFNFQNDLDDFMAEMSPEHPWLCFALYRALLQLGTSDLCNKTVQHLQTIATHLSADAKQAMTSLVLVPVLLAFADVGWDALKDGQQVVTETYSETVVTALVEILFRFLESSDDCRAIAIRHGGLKAVNQLLYLRTHPGRGQTSLHELLLKVAKNLLTSATPFSPQAVVHVWYATQFDTNGRKTRATNGAASDTGPVRSFLRGFSFSWGSDKKRNLQEMRDRSTSFSASAGKFLPVSKGADSDEQFHCSKVFVDEWAVYHAEVKRFVQNALAITGATYSEKIREKPSIASRFAKPVGADSTDTETETGRSRTTRRRRLSETSGYRSTSPDSVEKLNSHDLRSLHSVTSTMGYATESVALPDDDHPAHWESVTDMWNIIGLAVPIDRELCQTFSKLSGFDVALKLLHLITTSLSFHFESPLDFTSASVDATGAEPLSADGNVTLPDADKVSIKPDSFPAEDVSLDGLNIEFATGDDSANGVDSGERMTSSGVKILELKLVLFTSCLRICFFCAEFFEQFDVDVDDVMSTIRPAFQGKVSSLEFARDLYNAMFRAAVKPTEPVDVSDTSAISVLRNMQRLIANSGQATRGSSPGRGKPSSNSSVENGLHFSEEDDDAATLSESETTDGYEAESEAGAPHSSTDAVDLVDVTPSNDPSPEPAELEKYRQYDLDFVCATIVHPELLLLVVELLGNSRPGADLNRADSEEDLVANDYNAEAINAQDDVRDFMLISVMRSLSRLAAHSKQNLDKLSRRSDVTSACLSHFADILGNDKERWKWHRKSILTLCMTFNKRYFTSEHLKLLLSLFHSTSPPLGELLDYLLELVYHQDFAPSCFLNFSWMKDDRAILDEHDAQSDYDSDSTSSTSNFSSTAPTTPHRTITVWRVAPLRMPLENRLVWPPIDSGFTICFWLKVDVVENKKCNVASHWEGQSIVIESYDKDGPQSSSAPYIHLFSIGNKHTMLQVWLENTTLIFRMCVDPNDDKPVGLLAQAECPSLLPANQWQHLSVTYTESKMPDKAVFGKVHLILNSFIESDIILEFNIPEQQNKGMLSSWRQSTTPVAAATQKVTFFLGHVDKMASKIERRQSLVQSTLTTNVCVGNVMLFNQANFTTRLAFQLERLGPDASCLSECLSDSTRTHQNDDGRVRVSASSGCPWRKGSAKPSNQLFRLLHHETDSDVIIEEILQGNGDLRTLQESLLMSYSPSEHSCFHVYSVNCPSTPTKRRNIFRRTRSESISSMSEFSPLTQCSVKVKVQRPWKSGVRPCIYHGLNRALSQVGGTKVFLLLYAKVVEATAACNATDKLEQLQVQALRALFELCASDTKRREEFLCEGMDCMLLKVMTKSECLISYKTLQILFNATCSEDVIRCHVEGEERREVFWIDEGCEALIYDEVILKTFLLDWRIWHKAVNAEGEKDPSVWLLLLQSLEHLTKDEHPYQWRNIETLRKVGVVSKMLTGIQEILNEDLVHLPPASVICAMLSIVRGVIGSPPDVAILTTLCDFLIASHPPDGTFVCHSQSSFYFSLNDSHFPQGSRTLLEKAWKSLETLGNEENCPGDSEYEQYEKTLSKSPLLRSVSAPVTPQNYSRMQSISSCDEHLIGSPDSVPSDENYLTADSFQASDDGKAQGADRRASSTLETITEDESRAERPDSLDVRSPDDDREFGDTFVGDDVNGSEIVATEEQSGEASTLVSPDLHDAMNSWENLPHASPVKWQKKTVFERPKDHESLSLLVSEIVKILFTAVMTMRDVDVPKLLRKSFTAEMLLVLSHHKSPDVRAAVLKTMTAYFSRCSLDDKNAFILKKGFHLLGNQLHQHVTTKSIAEACLYFLLGHPVVVDEPLPLPTDGGSDSLNSGPSTPDPFSNHAVIMLLAILEKSYTGSPTPCCVHLLARLTEIFECMGPAADVMLDNGLTLALYNLLASIGNHPSVDKLQKETLYDATERILTTIAIKSCLTTGSGHFQVFEDLMILLFTLEKKFAKVYGVDSDQVFAINHLSSNLLLKTLDMMKQANGGRSSYTRVRRKSTEISDSGSSVSIVLSPPVTEMTSINTSGFDAGMTSSNPPASPAASSSSSVFSSSAVSNSPSGSFVSDASPAKSSFSPLSPRFKNHRRVASLGSETSSTSTLPTTPRTFHYRKQTNEMPSFRARSGGLRSRSFHGSQRRRINEAETAQRLQRVVNIAVDHVVFAESSSQNASLGQAKSFVSSLEPDCEATVELEEDNRDFCQVLYDLVVDWLLSILDASSGQVHQRPVAWERILRNVDNQLSQQAARLLVHLLSPLHDEFEKRVYAFRVMSRNKSEELMSKMLPSGGSRGHQVAVYLHYLLSCCKHQLKKNDKINGKKMTKVVTRLGHHVSSQHRRAIVASGAGEPHSPDPLDKFQKKFNKEHRNLRAKWRHMNKTQYELLRNRTSGLAEHVSKRAMDVTQQVVLQQNKQRKKMIAHLKDTISNDLYVRKKWISLLEQLAHERAVWYNPEQYPKSWQLDPTEGPCRERRRLQRCHIGVDKRFMLNKSKLPNKRGVPVSMDTPDSETSGREKIFNSGHVRPLGFIFEDDSYSSDSVTIRTRLQTNERISMVQTCINVTCACETSGEILIGEKHVYFVGDEAISDPSLTQAIFGEKEVLSLSWPHCDVREFHKRWWQLRDIALEIFLLNGKTYMLAFKSITDRDLIFSELGKLDLPNLAPSENVQLLTKSWCSGQMTNFEYLTKLNKAAGRSFNDLMQYPVMPFILSDYTSQILDLDSTSSYRILEKPISVQDPSREQHFKDRYKFLDEDYKNCTEDEKEMKTPPFHYGSHYSNSGTVLHFLVRLPPFTQLFLDYQDASFDIPDRTFHSMATTYRLSSYASTTDVKELIPEFFFLPEFLCNLEGFDFGLRQCGLRVHHVTLPLWSKEDPRRFVLIHRQALETDYVTSRLHHWIDLVFGYKQTGQASLDAVNVFHPATYFGMDVSSVEDPVKRRALETMVKTYGQTPKQLFTQPHPAFSDADMPRDVNGATKSSSGGFRFAEGVISSSILGSFRAPETKAFKRIRNSKLQRPISSVKGLQWGEYVGSPAASEPTVFLHKLVSGQISTLVSLQTNDVCGLPPKMALLVLYTKYEANSSSTSSKRIHISLSALVTYDRPDNIVRLKLKHNTPGVNLVRFSHDDQVTCCATAPDGRSVIFGTKSGKIIVQKCNTMPDKKCDLELLPPTALHCHTSKVTCISVCAEFRVFVSGSADGTGAIWDLDALCYVRSLTGHADAVTALAVSKTSGDICTVCQSSNDGGSHIRLWTINGSLLAAQDCKVRVRCVTFSSAPEGRSVNVLAGGLENGCIRLWSSWDLTHVRDVTAQSIYYPIVSVTFTSNNMVLYAATEGRSLVGWCRKDKEKEKQPLLMTFLDSKSSPLTG